MENSHEKKARRIATLLAKYMEGTITGSENDELDIWVGASDKNMKIFEELSDPKRVNLALTLMNEKNSPIFDYGYKTGFKKGFFKGIAASFLTIIVIVSLFIFIQNKTLKNDNQKNSTEKIQQKEKRQTEINHEGIATYGTGNKN